MAQESTTSSQVKRYQTMLALAGLALVIAIIGWVQAASDPIDTTSLSERLGECDGLSVASENEVCAEAVDELGTLLREYQGVLSNITVPANDASDATTTEPISTGTFRLNQ